MKINSPSLGYLWSTNKRYIIGRGDTEPWGVQTKGHVVFHRLVRVLSEVGRLFSPFLDRLLGKQLILEDVRA